MDSRLYIHRAENEIKLAEMIFVISEEPARESIEHAKIFFKNMFAIL
jgi:hypothetical protein